MRPFYHTATRLPGFVPDRRVLFCPDFRAFLFSAKIFSFFLLPIWKFRVFQRGNYRGAKSPALSRLKSRKGSAEMNAPLFIFQSVLSFTENGNLLTCKHRQRVPFLLKWLPSAVKTSRCGASVFACRGNPEPPLLGSTPNPLLRVRADKKIFAKTCFHFARAPPRRRSGGERGTSPFPFTRKGGERSGFTGICGTQATRL